MRRVAGVFVAIVAIAVPFCVLTGTADAKKKHKTYKVCKHGCKYSKIQKAVNKSKKKAKIKIKPGKYSQGAIVDGHRHDGLTIMGTGKKPSKVVLDGKNAHNQNGLAQNAIEGENVNNLKIKNMTGQNFVANGFFIHDCNGYLMKDLVAKFNRSYGLFAKSCIGGRMTDSTGLGHGDSAFYVGETPPQDNPVHTSLDHLDGHENVLGYSGTNSKYVDITDSNFYNNGVGVVPNTLDSEKYEPTSDGTITDNNIFWNNFNYFLPNSPVKTVSNGLGQFMGLTLNYPTGVGVAIFGGTGWTIKDNNIFGNWKWGSAAFSDPLGNVGDNAISRNNQFVDNQNGRNGGDPNGSDYFFDGSGSGNCISGNTSSTLDNQTSGPAVSDSDLYPTCPAPPAPNPGATNGSTGNIGQQFGDLAGYVATSPPENQQCSWKVHDHPAFKKYEPLNVTPGPTCP